MIRKSGRTSGEPSAFLLAEEAIELVFRAGLPAIAVYLIGTLPFLLGLLAYWAAMSSSAYAHRYASAGALAVALLFLWMKAFHVRYAHHLRSELLDAPLERWRVAAFFTTLCRQGAIHATTVIVYPVSFLTVLPMGFAIAWFQSVTVMDDGTSRGVRALMRDALAQAQYWPRQNHLFLWLSSPLMVVIGGVIYLGTFPVLDGLDLPELDGSVVFLLGYVYGGAILLSILPLTPFAFIVFVNVASGLYFGIEMLQVLTGADTGIARNPGILLNNSTYVALACGLTFVLLDPILKAGYAIRCHHGDARRSGVDIRVALSRIRRQANRIAATGLAVLIAAAALASSPAAAQPEVRDRVVALDTALDEELAERRYTWRMPRQPGPDVEMPWLLQAMSDLGETIRDAIVSVVKFFIELWERFMNWLRGGSGPSWGIGDTSFNPSLRLLIVVLVAALVTVTVVLLWRTYRATQAVPMVPTEISSPPIPDLEAETTTAADLPEDEWFQLARDLAGKGEYRLAARALFFAILATLADQEIIRIARFKSNMDYRNELARRAPALGDAPETFAQSAFLYETVWYGEHEASPDTLNQLHACQERLRNAAR